MSSTYTAPLNFAVHRVQDLIDILGQAPYWYFFIGDHRPTSNTDLPDITYSNANTHFDPWSQIIEGKQVTKFAPGIRNIPYQFGKVFDQYDDGNGFDPTISDYYCIVNAGSYSHVFKCLWNNYGASSQIQPDFSQVSGANSILYQTSDGYQWKYLCSTDSANVSTYATPNWFPVFPNTTVANAAVPGSISVIQVGSGFSDLNTDANTLVSEGGKGYDNYTSGTFQANDIRVNSIPTLFGIANSTISTANGYYTGCVLYITSGTGVGQYKTILDYTSTPQGNFCNLDSQFTVTPTNGSQYEILPRVLVETDYGQTVNCYAMATVNSLASNSISSVIVLNQGAGYHQARARVIANAVVGVSTNAVVRPIVSPPGGHGSDALNELGARAALISITLANTEGGLIPASGTFRQIGLMDAPYFANVQLTLTGATGPFSSGEVLTQVTLATACINATMNTTSAIITGDDRALFTQRFSSNLQVWIANGSSQFIATINSVANDTSLTLTSNGAFNTTGAVISFVTAVADSVVLSAVTSSNVYVTNAEPNFSIGGLVYGSLSQNKATITGITRNLVDKDFGTFNQLYKYQVNMLAGAFIPNEVVTQGANATGLVHSYSNGFVYLSNLSTSLSSNGVNLTGQTSGAIASLVNAFSPELKRGSSLIKYLENVPVTNRTANQVFRIAYQF